MLSQRTHGSEFLDRPDSDPALTERSFRFIRFVNRAGGGLRVVRRFLAAEMLNVAGRRHAPAPGSRLRRW